MNQNFIECHTLIVILSVEDPFDEEESEGSIGVMGQFLDLHDCELARLLIAPNYKHGDRLVIMSVYPEKELACTDVIVISESSERN